MVTNATGENGSATSSHESRSVSLHVRSDSSANNFTAHFPYSLCQNINALQYKTHNYLTFNGFYQAGLLTLSKLSLL